MEQESESSYDEIYDEEMARLEAEETGEALPDADSEDQKEETNSGDEQQDTKSNSEATEADSEEDEGSPAEVNELADVKAENERLQKRLSDAQNWGHKTAEEAKQLKQELKKQNRPDILDDLPGLEEGVKYLTESDDDSVANTDKPLTKEDWQASIETAIPDIHQLLGNDDFNAEAQSVMEKAGDDWNNPLYAIRHLTAIKTAHIERQYEARNEAAIEQAKKDFTAKQKRKSAMSVPSGGAGVSPRTTDKESEEVRRYENMTDEEFNKEVNTVIGLR